MKDLISSKDNSIERTGAIGKQRFGIIFWQKSTFRYCGKRKLKSIIKLIDQKYSPAKIEKGLRWYFIEFDHNHEKVLYLTIKKNLFRSLLYGESHTAYVDADFHIFVLELINYISTKLGSKICVDDATGYLDHRSVEKLTEYIDNFETEIAESLGLTSENIIENQNTN